MRTPFVAGNWKMNGSTASTNELMDGILAGMGDVNVAEVAVCAPSIYIPGCQAKLAGSNVGYGGQDLATEKSGAFTGEISADMLLDFGCKYVIVGHSERRSLYGETDEIVAKKFAVARAAGLTPILCIGETLEEREGGITDEVNGRQLDAVINLEGIEAIGDSIIAYEPVWAIGTGVTATAEQAQETHANIRGKLAALNADVADKVRILYGGSMKPGNAAELIGCADIDGGLIGGASLTAEDFLGICKAAG